MKARFQTFVLVSAFSINRRILWLCWVITSLASTASRTLKARTRF